MHEGITGAQSEGIIRAVALSSVTKALTLGSTTQVEPEGVLLWWCLPMMQYMIHMEHYIP